MDAKRVRLQTFAEDLDEDLLAYVAMKDGESSEQAAAEFYERHKRFLYSLLLSGGFARVLGGSDALEDVVLHAFADAFENAAAYRPCGSGDAVKQRRACRNWVVGIAKNLIRNALCRRVSVVAEVVLDDSCDLVVDAAMSDAQQSELQRIVGEVLDGMSEREQDVLRTTMLFYKPGEQHQRLPNDVAKSLAERLATTPENIRAIRKRAFAKLKIAVEAKLKGTQEGRR
jgi:RNA polymerase sigma factor (sigma-70 family)